MKRFVPTISIVLACAMLFLAVLFCNTEKTEERTKLYDHYYMIEPTSLLDSLNHGEMAFTPVSQRPELIPPDQKVTVNWHQADYFFIMNALYEGVLGKTLQGWQLSGMDFALGCSQIQNGFQNGRFGFFSVVKDDGQEARLEGFVDINPSNNFVNVSETKYSPKLIDLKPIDLTQIKISADQALQIAERNGGERKREALKNACSISLQLILDRKDIWHILDRKWQWRVYYSRWSDRTLFFDILIDPETGEVRFP